MAERGIDAQDFGEEFGISYGGKEQRIAWAINESDATTALENILNLVAQGGFNRVVALNATLTDTPVSYSTDRFQNLRFILQVGSVQGNKFEFDLQGSFDDTVWFSLNNGSITVTSNGLYTYLFNPLVCSRVRIVRISPTGVVTYTIGGFFAA